MKNFARHITRLNAFLLLALVALSLVPVARAGAATIQRREHLTEQEADMVRDTQELDRRVALFVKIAERRIVAVTDATAAQTASAKDTEKWGELPKGTRAQLFNDLARILDEAINNIDDVAVRAPNSSLIPKAVKHLAEASARFLPQLVSLRATASAEGEREALEQALDNMQQVLDAAKKLPGETTEKKDEKKKDEKKDEKKKN
jgi:ABC-type amino acid transport substrate-binding protein